MNEVSIRKEQTSSIKFTNYLSTLTAYEMHKAGVEPSHPPIIDDKVSFGPSKGWAEMIRKVFEVDPLICPQ